MVFVSLKKVKLKRGIVIDFSEFYIWKLHPRNDTSEPTSLSSHPREDVVFCYCVPNPWNNKNSRSYISM